MSLLPMDKKDSDPGRLEIELAEAKAEIQRLRDQQVERDPYGERVEKRVIWDEDQPVNQAGFDKLVTDICRLEEALKPLVDIVDAYDRNALDAEARKTWGKNDEHENDAQPEDIILYSGRGGRTLLTLADCFRAREASGRNRQTIDLRGKPLTRQDLQDAYEAVVNAPIGGQELKQSAEDLLWEAMRAWGKILEGEEVSDHTAAVNWLVDWLPKVKEVLK
jgi:hypothetical protein